MRWIKGYENKYSCNELGQIFRHYKNRHPKELKTYVHHNRHVVCLHKSDNGKEFIVSRLIYETWIGSIPKGAIVIRRNGILVDSHVDNLELSTYQKRSVVTGGTSRNKPVELLDDDGVVIDSWSSARKAAKDLFVSYQTVMDICNRKTRKKLVNVRWERC